MSMLAIAVGADTGIMAAAWITDKLSPAVTKTVRNQTSSRLMDQCAIL